MKTLWGKRIPTVLAFFIIFSSIWITSYLIQKGIITIGRASPDINPENIKISDIADTSFTVSFTTKTKTESYVNFGETENSDSVAYDDRDKTTGELGSYFSHRITVPSLKSQTTYYFSIVSNGVSFLDGEKNYKILTGQKIDKAPPSQNPIYGKIILSDGSSAEDTLVFVNINGAQLISALSRKTGEYMIPLNSLRTTDLMDYFVLNDNTEISIDVIQGNAKSGIKTIYKRIDSIPPITLSKNYDFSNEVPKENEASVEASLKIPSVTNTKSEIKITAPKNNDQLTDTKPTFKGTALPGEKVKIIINSSQEITGETTADSNGNWSFRPGQNLATGSHSVTIETTDSSGIVKSISQQFIVFASGSQVSDSATPSATPIVTPTSTPTPTTQVIIPTLSIQVTPTPTSAMSNQSPTPTIASTGNGTPGIILTGATFFLIIAGTFLFLGL